MKQLSCKYPLYYSCMILALPFLSAVFSFFEQVNFYKAIFFNAQKWLCFLCLKRQYHAVFSGIFAEVKAMWVCGTRSARLGLTLEVINLSFLWVIFFFSFLTLELWRVMTVLFEQLISFCLEARSHSFEYIYLNHFYADNFISIKFRESWMANGISPNSGPLAIALLSRVCHPFSLTYAFHYFERGQDISLSQRPEKEQWC